MVKFKTGDKVVCIDAVDSPGNCLRRNEKCTVGSYTSLDEAVLSELKHTHHAFAESRFEIAEESAGKPTEAETRPNISIKRVGDVATVEIQGVLSREQVGSILDIVYGPRKKPDYAEILMQAHK